MNDSLEHRWLLNRAIAHIKRTIKYADDPHDETEVDPTFLPLLNLLTGATESKGNDDDEEMGDSDYHEAFDPMDEIYCACFTSDPDSLSQWRAYADNGYGVAIGINPDVFGFARTDLTTLRHKNLELGSVCYDDGMQEDKLYDAIHTTSPKHRLPVGMMKSEHEIRYLNVWSVAAFCKNPKFESESEWRIVYRPYVDTEADGGSSPYRFDVCVRGKMLVPFYDLPLPCEDKVCKAIRRIVLGPSVSRESERSLRKFLESNLFHGVLFDRSRASYRPS